MLNDYLFMVCWRSLSVSLVCALALGCTKQNPRSCADGVCNDLAFPFCDVDGAVAGEPNTCIAVDCQAGEFITCRGDETITCNAMGNNLDVAACENGCSASNEGCNSCRPGSSACSNDAVEVCGDDGNPGQSTPCVVGCVSDPIAHCAYLEPKYLADICDTEAVDDLMISTATTLSTDVDANCTGGVVSQTGAPDICVVRNRTITVTQAATLTVVGARALALVGDTSTTITGVLDVSANGRISGPGGGTSVSGGIETTANGGGGAGFLTSGGAGGSTAADGGAANGGTASTNPAQLDVLVGGTTNFGGGGGAVALITCRGTLTVDGLIDAGGGGGRGGFVGGVVPHAGNGGGSGGNVVLQGINVIVTGQLYANGGGGGSGKPGTAATGNAGADGTRSLSPAPGGVPVEQEGAGGDGGVGGRLPGSGKKPGAAGSAGGGGGSAGFLQVYTPAGVTPMIIPAAVSPSLQLSLNVNTR
jgi:hypothetical protein